MKLERGQGECGEIEVHDARHRGGKTERLGGQKTGEDCQGQCYIRDRV